jgi:4-amino-4-deoxy-L-arabinose transferase-like glycosyltransferase
MTPPAACSLRSRSALAAALGVILLLAVILLQMVLLARANSATWDEADHTYAGYMQWKHGDFGLNPEHPPLVKFLATLPLLDMQLKMPPLEDRRYRLQEVIGGEQFVFQNNADAILFRARMAASVLTLLLALLVFLAAQEMFGTGAGFLALGLIAFDPNLLANSALVTTDAGQCCFLFWAIYAFYRYIRKPTPARLLLTGLVSGLALASKHSTVLLLPMLLALVAIEVLWSRRRSEGQPPPASIRVEARLVARLAVALLVIAALSITVLWAWYGFRYSAREDGLALNPPMDALLLEVPNQHEAHILALFARLHLFPQSYLYGFAHILIQSRYFTSYLFGTIYPHAVWFFFPVAMLVKSTLCFLALLVIAAWAVVTRRIRNLREILYLTLPAAIYLIVSMAGGMNIGIRHVLPVYVFLEVAIAGIAWQLIERNRRWAYPIAGLLLFQAVSVVHAFPAYMAYASEAFGGPRDAHLYLTDSSVDWGQQLKDVKRYLDRHKVEHCWFAYFGQGVIDSRYYGIPCRPLVTAASLYFDTPRDIPPAIDGPVLMSAGVLSGFEFGPGTLNPYLQFQQLTPLAAIDSSVFVFDGHFEIPLAAALSDIQKSQLFLAQKRYPEALSEAQQAAALAPDSAAVNNALANALDDNGQAEQALAVYQKALLLAQHVDPQFQEGLLYSLRQRLAPKLTQGNHGTR